MKVLDFFSGSESLRLPTEELGWEYRSVDNIYDAYYVGDIMEFQDESYKPDIIWSSPPCTAFTVAVIGRNWRKFEVDGVFHYLPKRENVVTGLNLVFRTLELIEELKPTYWFIENPRGMLRKLPMMLDLPRRVTVSYCQYGYERMKPTDIWTNNMTWISRPACKRGDPCHVPAPRGSSTGTQGMENSFEKSRVPTELLKEVLESCKGISNE